MFKDKNVSSIYKTYGMVECKEECTISISLDYDKANIINNSVIRVEDKKYRDIDYKYGEIYLNNNVPVQEIILYPKEKIKEKIVKVKIEYNKQRIRDKIKKIIIER